MTPHESEKLINIVSRVACDAMSGVARVYACIIALLLATSTAQAAPPHEARLPDAQRKFLADYCVECHNARKAGGDLRFDDISLAIAKVDQADRWQKVLNQLNSGEMPPEDARQPDRGRKTEFLDTLSTTLVTARKLIGDQGGRVVLRRLNQREYKNTIRALLGVEVDTHDMPADGGTGSFDTVGSSLFMSSDQFEHYLALGHQALDDYRAIAAATGKPPLKARTEAEVHANKDMNGRFERCRENREKYVRWTAAVDEAAKCPENLEIAAALRKKAEKPRPSSGVPYPTPMFFYLDWEQLKDAPSPAGFGFADAQAAFFEAVMYKNHFPYYADYQRLPGRDTGAWLLFYQAYRETYVEAGDNWPVGRYTLRMRVGANPAASASRRFVEIGQRGDDVSDFTVFGAHQVTGTLEQPQVIEHTVQLTAAGKRQFALRERRPNSRTAEIRSYHDEFDKTGHGPVPAIWVDWFEIEGPQPPTHALPDWFAAKTQDRAGAQAAIERFATQAFRGRTPPSDYLDRLVGLYEARRAQGESFAEALEQPLAVALASPSFLYLVEPVATGSKPRQLDGFELASRLSYFLWSGPPDEELLALARSDELRKPDVLAAQVDRLIADERSQAFVEGFAHQWLGLDRLDFFQFDFELHRAFDDSAKADAREEVYRTVACLLRENQSLRRLLKSDFVMVNGLLADYYGIAGVTGDEFRKVSLSAGSPRGGLLGMAAILAMGGNGQYTSPVERGAWVLRKLLDDPPPPAPPNVPQLARLEAKLLTVRERMKAHQEEPQCANCHRKLDPIGFGLENFDAAGKWRTEDTYKTKAGQSKTWPVEPAAAFHRGPAFANYFELREIIASRSDDFARGFVEALMEYALGRPYSFSDDELASQIIGQARAKDYALREFVQALVASEAFRSK